jgi:UDP-glucuronate 4-epimerase
MRILVTGAAGFIGAATSHALLDQGHEVVGLDDVNDYYETSLKDARLASLGSRDGFRFVRANLADRESIERTFREGAFERVAHLGAQAGVRHSIEAPLSYVDSNLLGTAHVLEGCRHHGVRSLVYASTSSVYGLHADMPYRTSSPASHPMSFYSATKRATELMAHSYSHLFGLPTTGLRFFTVYGPWGRPDMALFRFTRSIIEGRPIPVYNHGRHTRDFTYIDDIVRAVVAALERPAQPDTAFDPERPREESSSAPWRIYNVGCGQPVPVMRYIELIEQNVGKKAVLEMLPAQPGDVSDTFADTGPLERELGVRPQVGVEEGVRRFVEWFRGYYGI